MPDNENKNPLPSALSEGHPAVAKILLERDDHNSSQDSHGGQAPFPPSAGPGDEVVVEIQSAPRDISTKITDFHRQLQHPPATENDLTKLVDLQDSISEPADQSHPTQLPWWSRLLCIRPRRLFRRRRKTKTHLNNP
ncbi:hypothetical protein B9Z19DRAFT_1067817 [Tuber borchii]|uniref:Uncharacterized protein n=1 Tax=Tuber borchii TaxID=42251 RepID=A0A2T6ZHP1_TUBBO|nr:hypothetical protein B9Z19DRAFT_1067817 [Tuber borchii]